MSVDQLEILEHFSIFISGALACWVYLRVCDKIIKACEVDLEEFKKSISEPQINSTENK